jgi:hypothetical protein
MASSFRSSGLSFIFSLNTEPESEALPLAFVLNLSWLLTLVAGVLMSGRWRRFRVLAADGESSASEIF